MMLPARSFLRRRLAVAAVAGIVAGTAIAAGVLVRRAPAPAPPVIDARAQRVVQGGVAVALTVEPVAAARRAAPPENGEELRFRVDLRDASSGTPYSRVYP
ncbi:MAG TPA: hypothetical protein VFP84_09840, partial [Kofleriaceae bacterium]|nr:hypothetical protein [Kofleriaceae bacterium]